LRNDGLLLTILNSQVLLQQSIQIYVRVFGIAGVLSQLAVRNLRVVHFFAVDAVLADERASIFTKVVKNFGNVRILEYLFQTNCKWVEFD
jgi:hypothetical protein